MVVVIQSKWSLSDILKGDYYNPHVSNMVVQNLILSMKVANPEMWMKANPNLGKTVTYETYQLDVERAEESTRN